MLKHYFTASALQTRLTTVVSLALPRSPVFSLRLDKGRGTGLEISQLSPYDTHRMIA
ncbi:MAG: hypothetical protein H6668_10415 [Ardenticatenaceae bacterium]|nr:hypothetical protein [Ardenticatenaceae bacterium]